MSSKFRLDRRTFLRGSIGGALTMLALPPLEAMLDTHGMAYADGSAMATPLGVWFWGNGVRPDRWTPSTFGSQWDLSDELMPLKNVKSSINVLSNYQIKHQGTAHHRGRAGILTGTYDPRKGTYGNPTGPSLNYYTAQKWMNDPTTRTLHGSYDVGIAVRGKSTSQPNSGVVIDDSGSFINVERSPRAVFERFFDNFMPSVDEKKTEALRSLRASALDALKEDTAALQKRLGQADKERLESHLDGFRALERNLSAYEEATCQLNLIKPGDKASFYQDGRTPGRELLEEKHRMMSDMLVLALACDLTRVFSFTFSTMQSDVIFWQIGATEGSHVMTHDDRGLAERLDPQYENVHKSVVFIMQNFAYLLERLKAQQVGAQNLLERCCILATSEINDGTRHTYDSMPLIMAGNAGGKLKTGLHVDGKGDVATKALLTSLRAVGLEQAAFGDEVGKASDGISELIV